MKYIVIESTQVSIGFTGITTPVVQNIVGMFSNQELADKFIEHAKEKGKENLYWCQVYTDTDMFYGRYKSEGLSEVKGDNPDYSDFGNGVLDMLQ